MLPMVM